MDLQLTFTSISPSKTLYSKDIFDWSYVHQINSNTDLDIGTVGAAELLFTSEEEFAANEEFNFYVKATPQGASVLIGHFIIVKVEVSKEHYSYTCYDNVYKLNKIVDSWWAGYTIDTSHQKTLAQIFTAVCTECGVSCNPSFDASIAYVAHKNFNATNLTGRTLCKWITQCAGGFCYANASGVINIGKYTSQSHSLDPTKYSSLNMSNYEVPRIGTLTYQSNSNGDTATVVTTGSGIMKVMSNPLMWESGVQPFLGNMIADPGGWLPVYRPCTIKAYEDYGVNVGELITFSDGSNSYVGAIFEKRMSANGVQFSSTGNEVRNENTELLQEQIDYIPWSAANNNGIQFGTDNTHNTNKGFTLADSAMYAKLKPATCAVGQGTDSAILSSTGLFLSNGSNTRASISNSGILSLKDSGGIDQLLMRPQDGIHLLNGNALTLYASSISSFKRAQLKVDTSDITNYPASLDFFKKGSSTVVNTSIGTNGVKIYSGGNLALNIYESAILGYNSTGEITAYYPIYANSASQFIKGFTNTTQATESIATLLGGNSDKVKAIRALALYYTVNGRDQGFAIAYRSAVSVAYAGYGTYYAKISVDWSNNTVTYNLNTSDGTNPSGRIVALF